MSKIIIMSFFPFSLFNFKRYTFLKAFTVGVLIYFSILFCGAVLTYINWSDKWYRPDDLIKSSFIAFHIMRYAAILCITWLIFGRRGNGGYVFAFFTGMMLIVYHNFINIIPDSVPYIGRLDDRLIDIPGYIIIAISIYHSFSLGKKIRSMEVVSTQALSLLKEGKTEDAITLLEERRK